MRGLPCERLSVFDDFGDHSRARRTFKRPLIVVRFATIRLNPGEPHRHAAIVALWMRDFMWICREFFGVSHSDPRLALAGGSAALLSATGGPLVRCDFSLRDGNHAAPNWQPCLAGRCDKATMRGLPFPLQRGHWTSAAQRGSRPPGRAA